MEVIQRYVPLNDMRWREGGSRQRLLILSVLVLCLYVTRLKKKECNEEKKCFFCVCVEDGVQVWSTLCVPAREERREMKERI